jgi:hypothetical protein
MSSQMNVLGNLGGAAGRLGHYPDQQLRQFGSARTVIHLALVQRMARHLRVGRVSGVLDQGDAATALDCAQPCGAVVEHAREQNPDDAPTVLGRCGAEQRIDRRSGQVLARAAPQEHAAVVEQQVQIGRGHIDPATLKRQPVARKIGPQRARSIEDVAERAVRVGHGVNDHKKRGGKVAGEIAQHALQRLQSARRSADHDDVSILHWHAPSARPQPSPARGRSRSWCRAELSRARVTTVDGVQFQSCRTGL